MAIKCNFCKVGVPAFFIILLSLVVAYQFVDPPPPSEARIASGREGGGYHGFAVKYQKLLAEEQFRLDIQPTAGSIEVLKLLKAGKVSMGLVQGGTGNTVSSQGLQSLASLFYEPLWVFYRKERQQVNYLFDLHGKRIAVGEEGSGTRSLALQLLQDNKVTQDNTTFFAFSSQEALEKLNAGKIDAAFFVTSPTSSIISKLFNNPAIELMSFKRDTAYKRRYSYLTSVKIGEGMIDLEKNIPNEDKILLAATASLVARDDLHPDIIQLILRKLTEVHKTGGLLEKKEQFPSRHFVEFPVSNEAIYYLQHGPTWLQRVLPFWIASKLDRLKIMLIPLIMVMLPLLKSALPLYRWGMRFKIFRWYATLNNIDREVNTMTDLALLEDKKRQIKALQNEVTEQVSVPLSYMGEFYTLRVHVRLILSQLEERQNIVVAEKA